MDGIRTASTIILLAAVLPSFILGYLVAIKQKRNLIAGWNEQKVKNPEAFARSIGYSLIMMGAILGLLLFVAQFGTISVPLFVILVVLPTIIPAVGVVYAKSKYGK